MLAVALVASRLPANTVRAELVGLGGAVCEHQAALASWIKGVEVAAARVCTDGLAGGNGVLVWLLVEQGALALSG